MRRVALATLLCFACATSRPPALSPLDLAGDPPLRVVVAEPSLELWMEGTRRPSPEETAEALAAARSALASALDGRSPELASGSEADAFLVVRERAVARTGERRSAQVWSIVGVVVVVAFVVATVLLLRQGSSRPRRTGTVATPARVVPAPGPWRGPRAYHPGPSPFFFGWAIGVTVPVSPAPPPPAEAMSPAPPESMPPPHADAPPPTAAPPATALATDPAPDPLLDDRGWFDGDEVELVAELVDARNGSVRWRRALRTGADPRDARAMSALLDRLVEGQPFGARLPPREIGVRRDAAAEPARPPEGASAPPADAPPATGFHASPGSPDEPAQTPPSPLRDADL